MVDTQGNTAHLGKEDIPASLNQSSGSVTCGSVVSSALRNNSVFARRHPSVGKSRRLGWWFRRTHVSLWDWNVKLYIYNSMHMWVSVGFFSHCTLVQYVCVCVCPCVSLEASSVRAHPPSRGACHAQRRVGMSWASTRAKYKAFFQSLQALWCCSNHFYFQHRSFFTQVIEKVIYY